MFDSTPGLEALEPSPPSAQTLAAVLAAVADPALTAGDAVLGLELLARHVNWLEAQQAALLARVAGPDAGRPDYAAEEVAAALRITVRQAERDIHSARTVATRLPLTRHAWGEGQLSRRHVEAFVDATSHLDPALLPAVEAQVVPRALGRTVPAFRQAVARAALAADPDGAERRHAQRARERRVDLWPQPDGITRLTIEGPTDAVLRVYAHADGHARFAKRHAKAARSTFPGLPAARFDAIVDLVTGQRSATGLAGRVASTVLLRVTATLAAVQGRTDTPAHIDGHGPVPACVARRLAATARWQRITVDDHGRPVEIATPTAAPQNETDVAAWLRRPLRPLPHRPHVHDPGAHLADLVNATWQRCTFPSCASPAHRNDHDHLREFPAGPTTEDNLHPPCERHHQLRHKTRWRVRRRRDSITWTSPHGREYTTVPEPCPLE